MVKPRLLITRFEPHAQRLADLLNEQGVYSLAQPLLKIEPVDDCCEPFIKNYDFIIAVSRNAVKYTVQNLNGNDWPIAHYFAVGEATQLRLQKQSRQEVIIPNSSFNSEGLLALPLLKQLENRSILILRGVGGRELLKEELIARGASVDYYEPYQRVAIKLSKLAGVYKWQQQAINGAIISSVELLEQLIKLTEEEHRDWLKSLTLFSASERILKYARSLGFHKTVLLPSIVDQDIINYFTNEGSYE